MDADEATEVVGGEEEAGEGATSSSSSTSSAVVVSHGFGMKVHSGTIGHRELRVYYRQSYRHSQTRAGAAIRSLMKQYRTMGALAPIGKNKPKQTKVRPSLAAV